MIRFTVLFIFLQISFLIHAQKFITFSVENKPLPEVLKSLEKDHELYFAFANEDVIDKTVNISVSEEPLESFLDQLLSPYQFSYEILDGKFIAISQGAGALVNLQLLDQDDQQPLSFALVQVKGTQKGSISDVEGVFNVVWKGSNEDTLVFSYLGYSDLEIPISRLNSIGKKVSMSLASQSLEEYVVQEYINTGITTTDLDNGIEISPDDLDVLPGLAERDVLLSAQQIAGVNSNDESAAGINIRGSSRANTFIYWNNIPVYHSAHYFGNISSFIPSAIGKVNIYKNYVPSEFGGSAAGLITMDSKVNATNRFAAEGSFNLTHADAKVSTPLGSKSSFMIAMRRSFNDLVATPTFNSFGEKLFEGSITQNVQEELDENFRYNSQLSFTDLNAVWHYQPSEKTSLRFSAIRSKSVLDFNSSNDEEEEESDQNHLVENYGANLTWGQKWTNNYKTTLSSSYTKYVMKYELAYLRDILDGEDNDIQSRFNEFSNLEIRVINDFQIAPSHQLSFGGQLNFIGLDYTVNEEFYLEDGYSESIESYGSIQSLFAKSHHQLGKLDLIGSVRLSYFPLLDEFAIDPQIRTLYRINDDLYLKMSAGKYHQYINTILEPEFNFSNTIEQHWVTADRDEGIPLLSNEQFVIGAFYEKKGWLIDIDLFRKQVDGILSRRVSRFQLDDGIQSANERILGLDLMIRKRWKYLRSWFTYSHLDSEVEVEELDLFGFSSNLSIRHQFQFTNTFSIHNLELSIGYTFRTGPFYTRAEGLNFISESDDEDEEDFDPYYEIDYGPINEFQLPNYHRLDFSAWYKLPKSNKRKLHAEFGITLLNILNRNNVINRSYDIEEFENENIGIVTRDQNLLGITPNLSVRLRY